MKMKNIKRAVIMILDKKEITDLWINYCNNLKHLIKQIFLLKQVVEMDQVNIKEVINKLKKLDFFKEVLHQDLILQL